MYLGILLAALAALIYTGEALAVTIDLPDRPDVELYQPGGVTYCRVDEIRFPIGSNRAILRCIDLPAFERTYSQGLEYCDKAPGCDRRIRW